MDCIFLRELRVETVIGVYDWERRIRQTLIFDLELGTDVRRAAASGELADALDYAAVAKSISQFVVAGQFYLLESVAEGVATLVLERFPVSWLRLSVGKLHALSNARIAGVTIERGKPRAK
ncbi:MAG: dihydroneopterin aldolase [Nitrococcus mobilis]|nr:dihydroneopterin aldolase [Nitrococcus mobilis]